MIMFAGRSFFFKKGPFSRRLAMSGTAPAGRVFLPPVGSRCLRPGVDKRQEGG